MIEVTGNLWSYPATVRLITTNGTLKANGEAVMGRGCALEAKTKWPSIAAELGHAIRVGGNRPHRLLQDEDVEWMLWSFPVKHHWREKADLDLIRHSAEFFAKRSTARHTFVLPRPGCGNGGLTWDIVRPILAPLLDDRFHVITWVRP